MSQPQLRSMIICASALRALNSDGDQYAKGGITKPNKQKNTTTTHKNKKTSLRLIDPGIGLVLLVCFAKMPDLEARRQRLLGDLGAVSRREGKSRFAARQQGHGVVREVARH